jgi:hypothetical protein
MISLLAILALIVNFLDQERAAPLNSGDSQYLTPAEKSLLERESDVEARIRVYQTASIRFQKSIQVAAKQPEIGGIMEDLKAWVKMLSASLEDIETNINRKKKSRALIRYEIQVRKTADDLQDIRPRVPVESQDEFDSCLGRTVIVRKTFVDILFQR